MILEACSVSGLALLAPYDGGVGALEFEEVAWQAKMLTRAAVLAVCQSSQVGERLRPGIVAVDAEVLARDALPNVSARGESASVDGPFLRFFVTPESTESAREGHVDLQDQWAK